MLLYALMSPAGSYTDFHIDFGGSSVWYHIVTGRKIFLAAPPTAANWKLYEGWASSEDQARHALMQKAMQTSFPAYKVSVPDVGRCMPRPSIGRRGTRLSAIVCILAVGLF